MDYELIKTTLQNRGLDVWENPKEGFNTLDPKIIPLVAVLNFFNYHTTQSCEGHPLSAFKERVLRRQVDFPNEPVTIIYEGEHCLTYEIDKSRLPPPYAGEKVWTSTYFEAPWVIITMLNRTKRQTLEETVKTYNNTSLISWKLKRLKSRDHAYELTIRPKYTLAEMQQDIMTFTEFLHDQITRPHNQERTSPTSNH